MSGQQVTRFVSLVSFEVPLRAEVEIVSGDARIFSGESVRLKCSVRDPRMSIWNYYWFRESEQLPQFGEHLVLQQAHIRDSGKYSCQGVRETMLKTLRTQQSVAIEIIVDGKCLFIGIKRHLLDYPGHNSLDGCICSI